MSLRTLQMFRILAAFVAITSCWGLLGADAAATAAEAPTFTYIVVLHDGAETPDLASLGGEVLQQWKNRRVVRMSDVAIRTLMTHRAVQYIQRVQTDGELPSVPQPRRPELATDARVASNWAPPTWSSGDYVYDGSGNITNIGTTANPASDGGTESFVYDSADRLVGATVNRDSITHFEKYTYDSFGNLVNTERNASPSNATPASLATNRLTLAGSAYDNAGNVIASEGAMMEYVYDGFNMMRLKVYGESGAWYVYTADDERIGVEENGEQRWTIRDLSGRVLREWENASPWQATEWFWREDYVYRGSTLTAAEREPTQGGTRYFHADHLGTPRLITDSNKAKFALHDYFPFGVEKTDFRQEMIDRGTDRPEPMKFTGHERDFTGGITTNNRNQLDYMHARYYNPVWGRFLSVDPTWESADLVKPQSWNRYSYVINNPINLTDPDGRSPFGLGIKHFELTMKVVTEYLMPDGETPLFEKGYNPAVSDNPPRTPEEVNQRLAEGSARPLEVAVVPVVMGTRTTPPTLPDKTLATDGKVTIEHYYKSNDHPPAHAHVKGGGPDTRIGPNGHPAMKGDAPMTATQRKVYEANKSHVRRSINTIGRWLSTLAKKL